LSSCSTNEEEIWAFGRVASFCTFKKEVLFGHALLPYVLTLLLAMAAITNVAFAAPEVEDRGIEVGGNPYSIAVNPDKDMVYVADKLSKKISFVDGSTGEVIKKVNLTNISPNNSSIRDKYFKRIGLTPSIAVSSSFNLLYVAYTDSDSLWVLDGTTGDFASSIKVKGIPRSVYADPSSQYVYVSTISYW
jgi:DNA-binding beta-propeller fold protein YncE